MSDDPSPAVEPVLTPEQREPMRQALLWFVELDTHLDDWAMPDPGREN